MAALTQQRQSTRIDVVAHGVDGCSRPSGTLSACLVADGKFPTPLSGVGDFASTPESNGGDPVALVQAQPLAGISL